MIKIDKIDKKIMYLQLSNNIGHICRSNGNFCSVIIHDSVAVILQQSRYHQHGTCQLLVLVFVKYMSVISHATHRV